MMTDTKTLIKELKDPKQAQPYGIYEKYYPEKAEVFIKAGDKNCLVLDANTWQRPRRSGFYPDNSYILNPDYQLESESEYVDLKIIVRHDEDGKDWLGVHTDYNPDNNFLPHTFTHLHCLPSLPGFHCFWQEENNEGYKDTEHITFEVVATAIDGGNKGYARFRK